MPIEWKRYQSPGFFDELIHRGAPRKVARALCKHLASLTDEEVQSRQTAAELEIRSMGITFTVYNDDAAGGIDRDWPFDIVPRVIDRVEWDRVEEGLRQRVTALNAFVDDIYHDQRVLKDGVVPEAYILESREFRRECMGAEAPFGAWANVCGSDLVRDADGTMYVLEDNLRVPSGVSYMIENREVMKRVYPEVFSDSVILPVDDYPAQLARCLTSLAPSRRGRAKPQIVVLTPGVFNSAYFEHAYLAHEMAAELVEGADLIVGRDDCVYMRTIEGLVKVDVIYRRIDDLFIDPEVFHPDSILGVPGLMRAWRAGNVALANAPGCGVADDKVIYTYTDDIVRYFLSEEPLLPIVPSYRCVEPDAREYVLDHLDELVVKPANESGGYGILIGPHATATERREFAKLIEEDPRNYIGQRMLTLSVAPTLIRGVAEPRCLDLRPFILSGESSFVTTGGLTRVAMVKGSTVVNSSQGGGSKDTWIVDLA